MESASHEVIAGTSFGGLGVRIGVILLSLWLYVQSQQKNAHSPRKEEVFQSECGDTIVSG